MSTGTKAIKNQIAGTYGDDQTETDTDDYFNVVTWVSGRLIADTAGTDYTQWSHVAPFDGELVSLSVCPSGALTAADATANTFTLGKSDGLGGAITSMATLVTNVAGGDWVNDVIKAGTNVAAAVRFTKGQLLTLKKTHASTGTATPNCSWVIKVKKV
jgi:hypothetical protein